MKAQPDPLTASLFEPDSLPPASVPARSLRIEAGRLSPAQQRFNKLLARVEALTSQIDATRAATDAHRPRHSSTLSKLEQRHGALMQRMAVWLDERLLCPGLTAAQKRYATEILISLTEALAAQGDSEMQALHDRHSADALDAKQRADFQGMKEVLEDAIGKPLEGTEDPDDLEGLLQAAMKEMDEQAQATQARRLAQQEARRSKKAKTTRQRQAEQDKTDAQSALRTLFRQLASALHPDRETDPLEHKRKSVLMSEVNAAYKRRDLTALLKLQLRVEQADPHAISRMADEKVAALNLLLQDQVAALEQDLAVLQMQARQEFSLPRFAAVDAPTLSRSLAQQCRDLERDIQQMQRDLALVQDDAQFKRWLREQHKLSRMIDPMTDLSMMLAAATGFERR